MSSGDARPVGLSFSPLDQKLHLGTEGYSPTVLRKAVRQAGKALSFQDASDDLEELLRVSICPSHLFKLAERIGREWGSARDADVQAFRTGRLASDYAQAPVVAVMPAPSNGIPRPRIPTSSPRRRDRGCVLLRPQGHAGAPS